MPMPVITVPEYANVPLAAGVPFMLRSAAYPPTPDPELMSSDGTGVTSFAGSAQVASWGIYDQDGAPVIVPDSTISFSFSNDYRVSDYPVEEGAFASYNKVANPYDANVVMTKAGGSAERAVFLNTLAVLVYNLDLLNIVTPDHIYENANIVHYDYERSGDRGVSMLTVTIFLREIRSAPNPSIGTVSPVPSPLQNTQSPSGADAVHSGAVQTQDLTTSQQQSVSSAWGNAPADWGGAPVSW